MPSALNLPTSSEKVIARVPVLPRRGRLRADSAEARESRIGGGRGVDDHEVQQGRWRERAAEITSGARGYVEGSFMRAAEVTVRHLSVKSVCGFLISAGHSFTMENFCTHTYIYT